MFAFKYCKPNLCSPSCLKTPIPGAMNSLMQEATGNKPNGTLWPFPASQISSRMPNSATKSVRRKRRKLGVTGCHGEETNSEKRSFLSLEEAGLVEISGLSTHERFLCRLTISSLNLLRVVSEEEGLPIEELNAGRICDWFLKDKLKREQKLESAVLQWEEPDLHI